MDAAYATLPQAESTASDDRAALDSLKCVPSGHHKIDEAPHPNPAYVVKGRGGLRQNGIPTDGVNPVVPPVFAGPPPPRTYPGPPLSIVVDCSKNFFRSSALLPLRSVNGVEDLGSAITQFSESLLFVPAFFVGAACLTLSA